MISGASSQPTLSADKRHRNLYLRPHTGFEFLTKPLNPFVKACV